MIRRDDRENDEDDETVRMSGSELRAMLTKDTPTTAGMRDRTPDIGSIDERAQATPIPVLAAVPTPAAPGQSSWLLAGVLLLAVALTAAIAVSFVV